MHLLCVSSLWTLFAAFGILFDYVMDSDNSSSASSAGKVHSCYCGRRMSSIVKDFHTVCVDCDLDSRYVECADIDNSTMTEYVFIS